ncbi:Crp/Fnr family transcriptional regulator [Aerococcaceae bacterium WGS1372]
MGHSHVSCIRLVPILNHLDNTTMELIAEKAQVRTFKRGEFLYLAEQSDDSLYIVSKGKVRVYLLSDSGKEQLLRILTPGEFTGEWTLFNQDGVHGDYAQAMVDTTICQIRQEDFQALLSDYPAISMKLLSEMSKRLEVSEKQTAKIAVDQVGSRLAIHLVEQIQEKAAAEEGPVIVDLGMSRKDIASFLGTTPETISRKFRELEEEGLIDQLKGGKVRIHDLDDLLLWGG